MRDEMKCVVKKIKIGEIRPDPVRGQQERNEHLVDALVETIEIFGALELPIVRKAAKGSRWPGYWLITGDSWFAAAKKDPECGSIWCRVIVCEDEHALEIYLREKLQRCHMSVEQLSVTGQELRKAIERRERADILAPGRAFRVKNAAREKGIPASERYDLFSERLSSRAYDAQWRGLISTRQAEALCRMSLKEQDAELPALLREYAESKVRKVRRFPAQDLECSLVEPMGTTVLSEVSEAQDNHESTAVATVDDQADAKQAPESSALQVEGTGEREKRARWVIPRIKRCGLAAGRAS